MLELSRFISAHEGPGGLEAGASPMTAPPILTLSALGFIDPRDRHVIWLVAEDKGDARPVPSQPHH